jgi:hypothetical protein
MSEKIEKAKARRAPATPPGDTASYEQLQGSTRADSAPRKLEKTPNERDESATDTGNRLDQARPPTAREIAQAHDDIESGLRDTDRRGVPDDVPGSRENRGR